MSPFIVWYWRGGKWHPADPYVTAELGGVAGNVGALMGQLARMGYPSIRGTKEEGPPIEVRPLGQTYEIEVARARARVALDQLGHVEREETCGGWHCRRCGAIAWLDRLGGIRRTGTGIDLIGPAVSATCSERLNTNNERNAS